MRVPTCRVPAHPIRRAAIVLARRTGAGTDRRDEGQIMLLSIAFGVLALLLVTAVVSASSVHLERKRLLALADLTALAAADAVSDESYYGRTTAAGDGAALVELTPSGVRSAAEDHLARSPEAASLTDLTLVEATTDGRTAEVTLRSTARPPLLSWATAAWSDGVVLQVTARARAG